MVSNACEMEIYSRYPCSRYLLKGKITIDVVTFYGFHIEGYLTFTPHNDDDDTAHLSDSQFSFFSAF